MFESIEANALDDINIVLKLVDVHNQSIDQYEPEERFKMKQYYLSSAVTRLYAIIERFIERIIADYLDSLCEIVPFSNLNAEFKNEYRNGISHILSKIEQGRYDHLNHENVVEWYYQAIKGNENYRIVTDAMTRHQENFRLNIIENSFNKIQLKNFGSWIAKHNTILCYLNSSENIHELVESEITEFIQIRNDAAHGNLDNIVGSDKLKRLCELNLAIVKSVASFVRKSLLEKKVQLMLAIAIGEVTEVLPVPQAHIIQFKQNVLVSRGMRVLVLNQYDCYIDTVISIQDNSVNSDTFYITNNNYELGIKLKKLSRIGSFLYPFME